MWNFTGRALIIPYTFDDVKKQMQTKEEMCQSQKNVMKIDHKDILYDEKSKEDKVFEEYKDSYVLTAMDKAYNYMGNSKKELRDMSESECNKWMSTHDFTKRKRKTKYKVKIPTTENLLDMRNSSTKTNAFVLPLSL